MQEMPDLTQRKWHTYPQQEYVWAPRIRTLGNKPTLKAIFLYRFIRRTRAECIRAVRAEGFSTNNLDIVRCALQEISKPKKGPEHEQH